MIIGGKKNSDYW